MQVALRPYQEQAVYLLDRALNSGAHPLCVLPTGSGKSLVLAALLRQRGQKALVLSHVAELLEQDARALRRLAPEIEQSFYSAGLGEKRLGTQVVFGSVQSVYRNLEHFRARRPLLMIDEAHLCPRKSDAMYARVFDHFNQAQRVGFTATAMRVDSGSLVEGDDAWFNCIAHEASIGDLINDGYLLPLTGVIMEQQADLEGVATRGGEFVMEEAQAAVMRTLSLPAAVKQACELAKKRRSWLIFAAGIEHGDQIAAEVAKQGVDVATIYGDTDSDERSDRIERFRAGELRALVNVGVLTTGFDAPGLDCIISMRPTQSPVLWQQVLGRGMRLSEKKSDCLLLDFVGNLERLGGAGAVTTIRDSRVPGLGLPKPLPLGKGRKTGPRKMPSFFDASHRDPMLSGDLFDAAVTKMSYFLVNSRKQPGKRMLVAAYGLEDQFGRALSARAFVCVEYAGGARYHAVQWFARRGIPAEAVPHDALVALARARAALPPVEVSARFDSRLRALVIERERFV